MSRQRNNRRRGKSTELKVASMFDGARTGGQFEDVSHKLFSIETKSVVAFVANAWMDQCERNAKKVSRLPMLVVHTTKRGHGSDLVVFRMKEFLKLYRTMIKPMIHIEEVMRHGQEDVHIKQPIKTFDLL